MTLGFALRAARNRAGLTLEQVGRHFGVTRGTVSKWELGEVTFPIGRADQLHSLLGLRVGVVALDDRIVVRELIEACTELDDAAVGALIAIARRMTPCE